MLSIKTIWPSFTRAASLVVMLVLSAALSGCTLLDKNNSAGLQIITGEVPSTVFLNGQYLEKTPLIQKDIQPGEYQVRIQPDNSELTAHETQVTLRKGLLTVVTWKPGLRPETSGGVIYEMEPLKNKKSAEVSFVTIPDGAIVSLNGHDKEFSPVIIPAVSPGPTEFEVTLPSFETQRHTLSVVQGYRMVVTVKLAKLDEDQDAALTPSPSATSSASVSGQLAGPSAAANATQSGATGSHLLILPTGYFREGTEVLRVRESASPAGKEVGFATVGHTYPYLGESQGNWFKLQLETAAGWVSADYVELVQ